MSSDRISVFLFSPALQFFDFSLSSNRSKRGLLGQSRTFKDDVCLLALIQSFVETLFNKEKMCSFPVEFYFYEAITSARKNTKLAPIPIFFFVEIFGKHLSREDDFIQFFASSIGIFKAQILHLFFENVRTRLVSFLQ